MIIIENKNASGNKNEKSEIINYCKNKSEENNNDNYDMVFLEKYHSSDLNSKIIINQETTIDGKIINEYSNHKKEIIFNNKNNYTCSKKEIFDDGYQIVYFKNKDIKQIYPDGKEVYFFSQNKTVATTFKNGDKVYKFANGQIEKCFKNGDKNIIYPDGTLKNIYSNGEEEILYKDGSFQKKHKDGSLFVKYKDGVEDIIMANGNKERKLCNGKKIKMRKDGTVI